MTLADLQAKGFDIAARNHAEAIMGRDFPEALDELCGALADVGIPDVELIRGGGGEALLTQRLRRTLAETGWIKRTIVVRKIVDDTETAAMTHEIDHVRTSERGSVALEIEWNNKDPFFDRDLENFQRLHHDGAISVGVIVTRGRSLQDQLRGIVTAFAIRHGVQSFADLEPFGITPTARQRRLAEQAESPFAESWAKVFVSDKFGQSTTHWDKLEQRLQRGVGNPCPLLLVGIPAASVQRDAP
ncbi:MAG: restriction endonuclease [Acidimicrobiaceae bacterium]|nr:BglII/BstYI family type II restriction endonuclease [Acidimicrobiaceae bacterium]MXW75673.1 restriction endonuclease [Acidimicrobiaceae bacterium]MYA75826.1 restriction endonuclease [Acidimicrobiaceae bacterium]MYD07925.1 restriction endonuclease [Acidimicrobiaceae bacterium]MYG56444.1 restriction endonuclease [Acidimicrobiaceae bacterium]